MRIGELSRRTGVPVPTIKYYVREGLLPAGRLTSPNQASYGDEHEHRLRLIRALLDVGGLKVAAIAEVLAAVDDPESSVHNVLGVATDLLVPRYPEAGSPDGPPDTVMNTARERVAGLIERRGWDEKPDCPGSEALATALATLQRIGHGGFASSLETYADAAEQVAAADLAYVASSVGVERVVESAIVGTVLGESMFEALRHMAHASISSRLYGGDGGDGGGDRGDRDAGPGGAGRSPAGGPGGAASGGSGGAAPGGPGGGRSAG
ncbi:MerR family transcriptional regulator [Streptomyces sp. CAU 1734]|uniref:MerR family transcriptional regulator n=1 Tax=Streptomyces sp. CAU 1734 TaxID=3140360 RepID=UPI0032606FFC